MKMKPNARRTRLLALLTALTLVALVASLPVFAMGMGSSGNSVGGQDRGFIGRTIDDVESDAESIVDDLTDIPNGTDTGDVTNDESVTDGGMMGNDGTADEGLIGDEAPEDGTNIPDEDIGGAVADNDHDGKADAKDPDDDNDGISDHADTDADGDGMNDKDESTGIIGIVIAVLIVIAIIILVIAVIPRAKKR